MQEIKKLFFTYRNGAVADTLRRYGIPHKVIFGLQVPQLAAIARDLTFDDEADKEAMAGKLWADSEVRESRLLACYLFAVSDMTEERAVELARDCRTQEEADMLAFRLLKRLPWASSLLELIETDPQATRAAQALRTHLA